MQRLGVAAVGMYNRRALHILTPELNDDLKFFNLERPVTVASRRALSQADLLLGSFFFVHKSKSQHNAGALEHHEEMSAFEFLHNTFGEFLTADFILRQAMLEVEALKAFNANPILRTQLEQRLNVADGFSRQWFASLVYTPLFTRPVVLEMIREWGGHVLKQRNLTKQEFLLHLDTIILNQLKRLLSKREMPPIMINETVQGGYRAAFGEHPLLGHIAIYSINLILLRVIVGDAPFVFDESQIDTHDDGTRPWDRLMYIWRSWFALDNLNNITLVMRADRDGNQIKIRAKEKLQVAESRNRLQTCLSVAISLGDNISSGLTGLLLFDLSKDNQLSLEDISSRLGSETLDLEFQIMMKRLLQTERLVVVDDEAQFVRTFDKTLAMALHGEKHEELEYISLSLQRAIRRLSSGNSRSRRTFQERFEVFRNAVSPRVACEVAMQNPRAGLVIYQVAKEVASWQWNHEFTDRFFKITFNRHPMQRIEHDPDALVALLQLARELGGERFLERFGEELFERVFSSFELARLLNRKPAAFSVPLFLARKTESLRGIEVVKSSLLSFLNFRGTSLLGSLPITSLTDLWWLARKTGDPDLNSVLEPLFSNDSLA